MLEFIGSAVVSYIEKELVNAEPEIEALIVAQLEKLAAVITNFVNSKLGNAAPVASVADDSAVEPAVSE
jgi:hypothetical protein